MKYGTKPGPRSSPPAGAPSRARRPLWVALAAGMLVALAPDARAVPQLVLQAPTVTATGPGGTFDLLIANTNPTGGASYDLAVDTFEFQIIGLPGATITDVSIDTATPYVYVTSGTTLGGSLATSSLPATDFTATDSEFAPPGYRTIAPGDVFGLAHVTYALAPGTSGTGTLHFVAANSSLTDPDGGDIPFGIQDGSLTVVNSVPEPSALLSALAAAGMCLAGCSFRRRPAPGARPAR